MPSTVVGAVVSCTSYLGVTLTDTQCDTAALHAGYSNSLNTCYGCIDSFLVLGQNPASISSDLSTRYSGGAECDTFADDMQTLWNNYYATKVA